MDNLDPILRTNPVPKDELPEGVNYMHVTATKRLTDDERREAVAQTIAAIEHGDYRPVWYGWRGFREDWIPWAWMRTRRFFVELIGRRFSTRRFYAKAPPQ